MLNKNIILPATNSYAYRLSVFAVFLMAACCCNRPADNAEQAHFDSLLVKIDTAVYGRPDAYSEADITSLDSAFAVFKDPGIKSIVNKNLRKIVYYTNSKHDYGTAILYADSNTNLLQNETIDCELSGLYVKTLFAKGDIYYSVGNYDEAIRNYSSGKTYMASCKMDSVLLYKYYSSMAYIFDGQHKYLQAADFYRNTITLAPLVIKDPYEAFYAKQGQMGSLSVALGKAGMADSAILSFNTELDYIAQNEKIFANSSHAFDDDRAVIYFEMAELLFQQKDITGAEKLFVKSSKIFQRMNDSAFNGRVIVSLADLYLKTGQTKKAGDLLLNTTNTINTAEISSLAADYYKLLAEYYIKTGQPLAANNALLRNYNVKDTLEKRRFQLNSIDVRREFENREQNAANLALKKNNEIKNGYLLIAITSAVLGFIVILLIWYNLNRKSRFVKNLTFLNTEVGRKNDDLQKTFSSLEQSHNENNRIMRVVAHDLRNPISAIRTLVFSLVKKEPEGEKKEALALIQSTCTDSMALIKDLLDNKRSLKDISKELVDMGRLIEQCAELFQAKAQEKNQRISLQVDHPLMMLNRQKIWRVISNIVNNAIKFSPADAEIVILLERKDDSVLLSVRDNGIGIPTNLKEKIFTLDPEASRAGTAGEESHGLGLSISKKIIEEHLGRLWFESEAGIGSIFYVELPYSVN